MTTILLGPSDYIKNVELAKRAYTRQYSIKPGLDWLTFFCYSPFFIFSVFFSPPFHAGLLSSACVLCSDGARDVDSSLKRTRKRRQS